MAEKNKALVLDREQVKKAVLALQAFLKSKSTKEALFLNESQPISLLFTLWKIPKKPQSIRIPLPHNQRTDTDEVCLFTRDEPNMTADQTQRFYKRVLQEKGINNITEVIPYKLLKTEYKSIESKRRLLGNFDLFLSDDRIRRLLPSHLGKNFYTNKKDPLSVNLQSKHLARDLKGIIQGTRMKINNKGPCCMASVGHSGMTTLEITENIESAVKTIVDKMVTRGPVIKVIHLKSLASVALPIYTADLSHLAILEEAQKLADAPKIKKAKKVSADDDNDEEIPQLVPIETPVKKAKMEKPQKNKKKVALETAPAGLKSSPGGAKRKRPRKPAVQEKALKPNAQNKSPKPAAQKKTPKQQAQKQQTPTKQAQKQQTPTKQTQKQQTQKQQTQKQQTQKQQTQKPGKASPKPKRKAPKAK